MKTKILTLLFATSFLFVNCTSENAESNENFSLKSVTNDLISTNKVNPNNPSDTFTTVDLSSPDWSCGGEPTNCAPVIIVTGGGGKNAAQNAEYIDFIEPSVELAYNKGLVTKQENYNAKEKVNYVMYTDEKGDKLVYRFKQN